MNRFICFASTRVSWSGQVGGWRDGREGWGWVPRSAAMLGAFLGQPAMSRGGWAGQRASMLTVEGKEPSKGFLRERGLYLPVYGYNYFPLSLTALPQLSAEESAPPHPGHGLQSAWRSPSHVFNIQPTTAFLVANSFPNLPCNLRQANLV